MTVVAQPTNVLFDLILFESLRFFGPAAAQQIAVSVCVLVFFWGSFVFVRTLAGQLVWWLAPALAMLSYGWLFHSGFFNFYLSLGICLFAISLWLKHRRTIAVLLLLLACIAHSLPVALAIGIIFFLSAFSRYMLPAALAGLIAIRIYFQLNHQMLWYPMQIANMSGFDQLDVFGSRYEIIVIATLLLWAILSRLRMRRTGTRPFLASSDVQLLALLSLAMLILPTSVQLPGYTVLLGFLPNRLSIAVALVAWAVAARIQPPVWIKISLWPLMIIFGFMLYQDTGKYNAIEDELVLAIDHSVRGQRIVSAAPMQASQTVLLTHMIDRACVDRCFSYANYEPSTFAFRLRATAPNPFVVFDYDQSMAMQEGKYVVTAPDLPLFQANICPGQDPQVKIVMLNAGQIAGIPNCPH